MDKTKLSLEKREEINHRKVIYKLLEYIQSLGIPIENVEESVASTSQGQGPDQKHKLRVVIQDQAPKTKHSEQLEALFIEHDLNPSNYTIRVQLVHNIYFQKHPLYLEFLIDFKSDNVFLKIKELLEAKGIIFKGNLGRYYRR